MAVAQGDEPDRHGDDGWPSTTSASSLPGGERWTRLGNALHFLTDDEAAGSTHRCGLPCGVRRSGAPGSPAIARTGHPLGSDGRAGQPEAARPRRPGRPTAESRLGRLYPEMPRDHAILCPVLFAPYKHMAERLTELLGAIAECGDQSVRVAGDRRSLRKSLRTWPIIRRSTWSAGLASTICASSGRAAGPSTFPTGIESFGYPLAEARVSGQPVIARDTEQNREIAGPALCGFTPGDADSLRDAVRLALAKDVTPDPAPFDPDAYFSWLLGAPAMTALGLRPYRAGDEPAPQERSGQRRHPDPGRGTEHSPLPGLGGVGQTRSSWSTPARRTALSRIARSLGAEVVEQPWLGFSAQREFALRLPQLRHDWVYFVDADEWVSPQLAIEIARRAGRTRLQRIRASLPARLPGHLDPALRLVHAARGSSG